MRGIRDERSMGLMQSILLRSFGRPQGTLGKLGGLIMARMNVDCGTWVTDLLEIDQMMMCWKWASDLERLFNA
jgi:hypothetical protein